MNENTAKDGRDELATSRFIPGIKSNLTIIEQAERRDDVLLTKENFDNLTDAVRLGLEHVPPNHASRKQLLDAIKYARLNTPREIAYNMIEEYREKNRQSQPDARELEALSELCSAPF